MGMGYGWRSRKEYLNGHEKNISNEYLRDWFDWTETVSIMSSWLRITLHLVVFSWTQSFSHFYASRELFVAIVQECIIIIVASPKLCTGIARK